MGRPERQLTRVIDNSSGHTCAHTHIYIYTRIYYICDSIVPPIHSKATYPEAAEGASISGRYFVNTLRWPRELSRGFYFNRKEQSTIWKRMDKREIIHPLHKQVVVSPVTKNINLYRCMAVSRFLLYVFFFKYRFLHHDGSGLWLTTTACEFSLALWWLLGQSVRWFPVERETFPERLSRSLPPVDIFITTADPLKEPLIITMNTVLSVLSMDYPAERIACYVSDDAASGKTFWALVETSRFAKKWLPFCKEFEIEPRAPKEFFKTSVHNIRGFATQDHEYQEEFQAIKREYDTFEDTVHEIVASKSTMPDDILFLLDGESRWPAPDPRNHPAIFKVLLDQKNDVDVERNPVPSLFYVSRQKKPHIHHRFKAGAMNSLIRISGLITNSPFVLNLDCDTYTNNSKAIRHAMCFFMDPMVEKQVSFVQFPQRFHGVDEGDLYGNRMKAAFDVIVAGMDGVQGPLYCGTGCVHRRAALYGNMADMEGSNFDTKLKGLNDGQSFMQYEHLVSKFGRSNAFASSVRNLYGQRISSYELAATHIMDVISCDYENGTEWGNEVGLVYGSTTEDVLTGLKEHGQGWRSIYCRPYPDAFIGCAPTNGPDVLTWRKRGSIGLLEIFLGKHCPLQAGNRLMFIQRVTYIYFCSHPLITAISSFTYTVVQGVCLISGKAMTPKVSDPSFGLFALLFVSLYFNSFILSRWIDLRLDSWWNEERMVLISAVSSSLFAVFEVFMKLLGVSEPIFIVTPKKTAAEKTADKETTGSFVFNSSPLFIPPTALAILNSICLLVGIARVIRGGLHALDALLGQVFCCCWAIFCLYPFMRGLVKRGDAGIPVTTIVKSTVLAAVCCLYGVWNGMLQS